MIHTIINILMIAVICCCIIDISGFIESLEDGLTKMLKMKTRAHIPKPFSCSLCMTHWWGVIAMLVSGCLSVRNYMLLLLVSIMTPVITDTIMFVRDLMKKTIISLSKLLKL